MNASPAAKPHSSRTARIARDAGRGALLLGGVGFLCGFLGPIALSPEANQGPLLGIFITGPIGVLLGAVLGAVAGVLRVSSTTYWNVVGVACTLVAATTLCFSTPVGVRSRFLASGATSHEWPPEILANLLNLQTIAPAPEAYEQLVGE